MTRERGVCICNTPQLSSFGYFADGGMITYPYNVE
jgi:hypothetical protein